MVQAVGVGIGDWEHELGHFLVPFVEALGDRRRGQWAPVYVRGLLGPGDRKSIQPMAARVAPADYAQLHHFVAGSDWDPAPVERVLAREAQRLVGGPEAPKTFPSSSRTSAVLVAPMARRPAII